MREFDQQEYERQLAWVYTFVFLSWVLVLIAGGFALAILYAGLKPELWGIVIGLGLGVVVLWIQTAYDYGVLEQARKAKGLTQGLSRGGRRCNEG